MTDEQESGQPRASIGLVVRNGEAFLEETTHSLLSQTYPDFELVISDNASTDATPVILDRLARSDSRIRLHRFATNQGPAANYNKVAQLAAATDYFMWSAADDVREPAFLERCVSALDAEPGAVLAYSRTKVIEAGRAPRPYDYDPDVDGDTAPQRLASLLTIDHRRHGAFEIFGVMRLPVLRDVLPQGSYARSDSVVLVRMALRGRFIRVPEYLFLNRNHPDRSVRTVPARSYGGAGTVVRLIGSGPVPADEWWDAAKRGRIVWPEWKLAREYVAAVADTPLSAADRRSCHGVLVRYLARHTPKLGRDVLINAEFQLRRSLDRGVRSPVSP